MLWWPANDSDGAPLILRSLVYLFVLLLFQACQYVIIVFHLNAPLSTAAFAMGQVAGIVTNAFYSPDTRAYLYPFAACTILSAAWTGLHLIYGFVFSWKCCVFWIMGSMLYASSSLPLPVSWNQVQTIIVPVSTFVTVTRRSYTGQPIPSEWQTGHRRLLRFAIPGFLRIFVLWAAIRYMQRDHVRFLKDPPEHVYHTCVSDAWHATSAAEERRCADFNGQPLSCNDLDRARHFNKIIMPDLSHASYREVRTRMSQAGLSGSHWHVGHATPDPNKRSLNDREDFGWNLFCQGARDNIRLGHRLVSCSEAAHYGAFHVNCSI